LNLGRYAEVKNEQHPSIGQERIRGKAEAKALTTD